MDAERVHGRRTCPAGFGWVVLGVSLLLAGGCRAAFRYPVEDSGSDRPDEERLLEGMQAFYLTDLFADRIVFEIDWVEGVEPHPEAIQGLERTLRQYVPHAVTLDFELSDEIPAAEWEAAEGEPERKTGPLARHLDHAPRGVPRTELVYVVYVPDQGEFVGLSTDTFLERHGTVEVVPTLFIYLNSIARESWLWITTRKVEKAILVHEVGHVLGLVSHPDHTEKDNPRHCTEPQCVMAHFRARSQLYNALPALFAGKIPDDYGNKCRRDIAQAQELWAAAAAEDPGFVERVRQRREVERLRKLACWYGAQKRWGEAVLQLGRAREVALAAGLETATMEGDPEVLVFRQCPN